MNSSELPIACNLNDSQFQRRRTEPVKTFQKKVLEIKELDEGFAYRFAADENQIADLAQLITFERECCPFLEFNLRIEAANGPVWLELTGPEGTKDFLQSLFTA